MEGFVAAAVAAFAAGAAAVVGKIASEEVGNAYKAVRDYIVGRLNAKTAVAAVVEEPHSPEARALLSTRIASGVNDDAFVELIKTLAATLEALQKNAPANKFVDAADLQAIRNLTSTAVVVQKQTKGNQAGGTIYGPVVQTYNEAPLSSEEKLKMLVASPAYAAAVTRPMPQASIRGPLILAGVAGAVSVAGFAYFETGSWAVVLAYIGGVIALGGIIAGVAQEATIHRVVGARVTGMGSTSSQNWESHWVNLMTTDGEGIRVTTGLDIHARLSVDDVGIATLRNSVLLEFERLGSAGELEGTIRKPYDRRAEYSWPIGARV